MVLRQSAVAILAALALGCGKGSEDIAKNNAVVASDAMSVENAEDATGEVAIKTPDPFVATEATRIANQKFGKALPLGDQADFDDARRGFIGAIEDGVIRDAAGKVVWDQSRYAFMEGEAPASVNPSLWRQAMLNNIHGLFEVVDGVYQVRGYDLSVMTVIRGETGWILVDPLLTKETSAAALALVNRELGDRPVAAVLFTHSHADHFGGVRGVASDEDVAAGRIRIIAPVGFAEAAINENILAGNAMSRRAGFQFGNDLEAGPAGQVDSGIGKALSAGVIGFMQPTENVTHTGEQLNIDGVEFVFINAPDTEAPAEFMFYLPQFRALHTAELATGTMHNVLTLRGAKVRDALEWAKHLDQALLMFGDKSDVVLASHNWPTWGGDQVVKYLANQRDAYRFIHDQTLRLANQGYTMHEIADRIGEAEFMRKDFSVRGYYGTVNHNSKATYQRYFGWWDGNPANLNPHPPEAQAKRMVDLAGGADAMIANASKAFDDGDYRWVATVMNQLVFAEPENETAKAFLAGAYEQLGFQSESSIWRNYYLTAAKELRVPPDADRATNLANADFVKAVPSAQYFDAMATRVNPEKASSGYAVNFNFSDTGEKFGVKIAEGIAVQRQDDHFDGASITVNLARADLDDITLGRATFKSKFDDGSIKIKGDPRKFRKYMLSHDQFPVLFNVVTP